MYICPPSSLPIELPGDELTGFYRRWQVTEFALSGSVLRADFRPESDIDVMVAFSPQASWSLLDLVQMQQELEDMFRRQVHLIEKGTIHNPFRLRSFMQNYQVIFPPIDD